jgi:Mn-dependent DtxR family transcriptional regulator
VVYRDVEGMEHHVSPSTLRAIATLTQQLKRRPNFLAQMKTAGA